MCTVIRSASQLRCGAGLDNPRGVSVVPGGLMVAEAGRGGCGPCQPGAGGGDVCLGSSGALTLVGSTNRGRERWWQRRVVTGLPSLGPVNGEGAIGPHHVSPYAPGQLVATIGLGGNVAFRDAFGQGGRLLGTAVTLRPGEASVKKLADLLAYEAKKNPDSGDPAARSTPTRTACSAPAPLAGSATPA
jgi:hypothetical protein